MFIVFFCLSIMIFIATITFAYKGRKKQTRALWFALLGIIVATAFLVFPLYYNNDIITVFINTIFYAIKISAMSGDFDILQSAPKELFDGFKYILYLYSVLAPILAAGVIISFISNEIDEIRAMKKTNKTVHIFSEINEKSVLLAGTLKQPDNIVIFCDKVEKKEYYEQIKNKNGIILKKDITTLHLKQYLGEIRIYEISNNQDQNLNQTLDFIAKKKNMNLTIYLFSMAEEARVILDSTEKGNIKTIVINESLQLVYQVLDEKPLYQNVKNGLISVLIVGAGKIGIEFLKTITWCGQMINYKLEIHIVDKKAETILKQLEWKYPELKKPNYEISFHEVDINTIDGKKILDNYCKNTNYIIVSLGDDNLNLNSAIALRRYFLIHHKQPFIGFMIQNKEKKNQIEVLKNERGNHYDFYPFGSIEDLYGKKNILNEKIENLAKEVHLSYNPSDKNFLEYYKIEYYKNSSRATALHIKYKLYSIFGSEEVSTEEIKTRFSKKEIRDALAKNEHERWMAYMRADGYQLALIDEVEKYEPMVHHHVYHLAKLHPGLVKFEELDSLSKKIEKVSGKKMDLKKSDYDIIDSIPEIIKKAKQSENNHE